MTTTFTKLHPLPLRLRHHFLRRLNISAAALHPNTTTTTTTTTYTPSPILKITPATTDESLFHVTVDVSHSPTLFNSYSTPGQYLQLRVPYFDKIALLSIASPPSVTASKRVFEFLVKSVVGSAAEAMCRLDKGDVVEMSCAMGKGFDLEQLSPIRFYQTILIFATGSGISPIRSLIESGFSADKRSDVRLYYGARNLKRMAYQDRFKDWESSGVKIVPVLSQPEDPWIGERGYVQAAFSRAKNIFNPQSTGAILCGQRQMTEEVTSLLVADGVSSTKILKNF